MISTAKEYLRLKKHLEASTGLILVSVARNKCLLALTKIGLDTTCIPCKHLFAIFTHRSAWSWNNLPQTYLQSAYLSTDTQALQDYFQSSTDNLEELSVIDTENHPTAESGASATNLPKPVSTYTMYSITRMHKI